MVCYKFHSPCARFVFSDDLVKKAQYVSLAVDGSLKTSPSCCFLMKPRKYEANKNKYNHMLNRTSVNSNFMWCHRMREAGTTNLKSEINYSLLYIEMSQQFAEFSVGRMCLCLWFLPIWLLAGSAVSYFKPSVKI